MIFVTGPLYSGKREYIRNALHLSEADFSARAVCDVQALAPGADLPALADELIGHRMDRSEVLLCDDKYLFVRHRITPVLSYLRHKKVRR